MNPILRNATSTEPFGLIDVTLRDAHQCLWATRMTTAMMTPILSGIDRVGYAIVNVLGGAVFDVCVRFLHENPYRRVALLCERLGTPCDALTRGQSLYTFELFPDDVVTLNAQLLARLGVRVLTVYDALNDNRNVESSIHAAHAVGMQVNGMITYTLSPVHTDAYYADRARELRALGCDYLAIKDPTGLLTPERAATLFPTIVAAAGTTPLQLHSHCQSGLAPQVYTQAIRAGFRYGHTAVRPLANGASLPAAEDIEARARFDGRSSGIDRAALAQTSGYFDWLAEREGKPRGVVARHDPALYAHQVPGGMISNLKSQLATMGMEHRLPQILEEVGHVREDLGYPILVSPFAQYIVTQAVLNVVSGERYKTIPDEVRKYAAGRYGRLAASPSPEFLERAAIRNDERFEGRVGDRLQPALPRLRRELGATASDEEMLLAAFYDRRLLAPLARAQPAYEFETTPLRELIRHIGERRDLRGARLRFAGTEMHFAA